MKKIIFTLLIFVFGISNCNATTNEKYFKTICEDGIYTSIEISADEFNSITEFDLLSTSVETEYKKMSLSNNGQNINLSVTWKKTPKYKSYDVIAVMSNDVTFYVSSLVGLQTATVSGSKEYAHYNYNSQNVKIFDNGIGISMNLINNATYYVLDMTIRYYGNGLVYGNYRHAQSNVTLAQSQDYYLSNGNIVFNNSSISSKYDSISPVQINV